METANINKEIRNMPKNFLNLFDIDTDNTDISKLQKSNSPSEKGAKKL
jgi:hypothetical protein